MSKMVYVSHFKHCTHALGKKPFEAAAAATADTLGGGGITHTATVRSSTSIKQALMAWMEVLTSHPCSSFNEQQCGKETHRDKFIAFLGKSPT